MAGDVNGLMNDADFQKLDAGSQRQLLVQVSGDKRFSDLSDDDTKEFIAKTPRPSEMQTAAEKLTGGAISPSGLIAPAMPLRLGGAPIAVHSRDISSGRPVERVAPVQRRAGGMQESVLPRLVRGTLDQGLTMGGAAAGAALASPTVAGAALGGGLGYAAGDQAAQLIERGIFGNESQPSPASAEGLERTATGALTTAATGGTMARLGGAPWMAPRAAAGEALPASLTSRMVGRRMFGRELSPEQLDTIRPAGKIQPPLANTPRQVIEHAVQEGIDLTPFQASEKGIAGELEKVGEHGLAGGQKLRDAMNAQRANFGDSVNRMGERVDPQRMGLSEEQAGETIKQWAGKAKETAHENATGGYQQIDHLMPEKVDPKGISSAWLKLRENLPTGAEDRIVAQAPRSLSAVLGDLLSGKPEGFQPTFQQGIQLRSMFRELGETEGLPSSEQGIYRQMSKAVDKGMEKTAGDLDSAGQWRGANAGWKEYTGKYGDSQSPLVKILRQNDPATVTRQILNRGSANDIVLLKEEKMDGAIEALRRQTLNDIAKSKFTVGRDGLGGYSDSFLEQLFGPAKKELYLKADLARRMSWDPNPSGTAGQMQVAEQLWDPRKMVRLFGAAKASMPRPAASYLPRVGPATLQLPNR